MNNRFDPFNSPKPELKAKKAGKKRTQRRRRPTVTAQEALERIQSNPSEANYAAVISGFAARGIPVQDIKPKENVLTFNAWIAKGRRINKGESSVKITTWTPINSKKNDDDEAKRPRLTLRRCALFHISQTHPIDEAEPQANNRLNDTPTKDLPSWLQ